MSESSLAESFGVSKTPVREALYALKQEGLIDIKPQKGSFVFKPNVKTVQELCSFRGFLEPHALREAMRHAPEDVLEELEVCITKMARRLKAEDYKQFLILDGEFHETFVKHCNNQFLQKSYYSISAIISALRTHLAWNEGMSASILDEHKAIIACLDSNDLEAAAQKLHQHIVDIQDTYTGVTE